MNERSLGPKALLQMHPTKELVCACCHDQLFVTPCTVAHQAPLSMEFSGKNTGVGCHFLLQGDLPKPGVKPVSLVYLAMSRQILYQMHHLGRGESLEISVMHQYLQNYLLGEISFLIKFIYFN